jgi:hypothetical protein
MLDELTVLREAAQAYRTAATEAGVAWADQAQATPEPPELVCRLFDVDHVAEQLVWLQSQPWHGQRVFPSGGSLMPWPTDVGTTLDYLAFSIGTPFPWRHQMPLFSFDRIMYSFVLAGDREGEVWRYEYGPDVWDAVRAAPSLATLFDQWTKGIADGIVAVNGPSRWLQVGYDTPDDFQALVERGPGLDPFAFPVSVPYRHWPLLRERQRECGVDMDCIEQGPDCHEELLDVVDATRASLES